MTVKNATYDRLKFTAVILLPTLGTLYFALGGIWNLPSVEQVVGTITAVDTALGALVAKLSSDYSEPTDGSLQVVGRDENGMPAMRMVITSHPEEMEDKGFARLEVPKGSDLSEQ